MKPYLVSLSCLWLTTALSVIAQESPRPSAVPDAKVSLTPASNPAQPGPEMRKVLALSGRWFYQIEYAPVNASSAGRTTEGKAVFRAGPAGRSLVEDKVEAEGNKTTSGHSVMWWEEKSHGYRVLRCYGENPDGCAVMTHVAKWEGDQLVLSDEYTKDGKKYVSREVLSEITPTSFTITLSQGEAGKDLKRTVTIHATKAGRGAVSAPTASPTVSPALTPKPK